MADLETTRGLDNPGCSVDTVLQLLQRLYSIMEQSSPTSKNGEMLSYCVSLASELVILFILGPFTVFSPCSFCVFCLISDHVLSSLFSQHFTSLLHMECVLWHSDLLSIFVSTKRLIDLILCWLIKLLMFPHNWHCEWNIFEHVIFICWHRDADFIMCTKASHHNGTKGVKGEIPEKSY